MAGGAAVAKPVMHRDSIQKKGTVTPVLTGLHDVGVSLAQHRELWEVFKSRRDNLKPLVESMEKERQKLVDLVTAKNVDEASIRAQVDSMTETGADLAVAMAELAQEMRAVLTPEQQKKLEDLKWTFRDRLSWVREQVWTADEAPPRWPLLSRAGR